MVNHKQYTTFTLHECVMVPGESRTIAWGMVTDDCIVIPCWRGALLYSLIEGSFGTVEWHLPSPSKCRRHQNRLPGGSPPTLRRSN